MLSFAIESNNQELISLISESFESNVFDDVETSLSEMLEAITTKLQQLVDED